MEVFMCKTLDLTLKKKWFDLIASGEKKEEYREIKVYWTKRLVGKEHTHVRFRNGYARNSPVIMLELKSIIVAEGREEWGAKKGDLYFVLKLGQRVFL